MPPDSSRPSTPSTSAATRPRCRCSPSPERSVPPSRAGAEQAPAPTLEPRAVVVLALGVLGFVVPILPAIGALGYASTARRKTRGSHGRRTGDGLITAGIVLAGASLGVTVLVAVGLLVVFRPDIGHSLFFRTYLSWKFLTDSFPAVRRGFLANVKLFLVAEVVVLAWGLLVAVLRGLPGAAATPLRWLAIAYIDVFRGLPALLTIYLIGFGAPIAHVPWLGNQSLFVRGTVALTLEI